MSSTRLHTHTHTKSRVNPLGRIGSQPLSEANRSHGRLAASKEVNRVDGYYTKANRFRGRTAAFLDHNHVSGRIATSSIPFCAIAPPSRDVYGIDYGKYLEHYKLYLEFVTGLSTTGFPTHRVGSSSFRRPCPATKKARNVSRKKSRELANQEKILAKSPDHIKEVFGEAEANKKVLDVTPISPNIPDSRDLDSMAWLLSGVKDPKTGKMNINATKEQVETYKQFTESNVFRSAFPDELKKLDSPAFASNA